MAIPYFCMDIFLCIKDASSHILLMLNIFLCDFLFEEKSGEKMRDSVHVLCIALKL